MQPSSMSFGACCFGAQSQTNFSGAVPRLPWFTLASPNSVESTQHASKLMQASLPQNTNKSWLA